MRALTKKYLVTGLNQKILLDRLNLGGVELLKIKKVSQKALEITIDIKDDLKFFAICKNMWYNKLIGVGGFLSPFYLLVKNPLKFACLILSLVLIICSEWIYLGNQYQGDAPLYRVEIQRAFDSVGIKKYAFFSDTNLRQVQQVLQRQNNFAYVSIQKRGNRAVVNLQALKSPPQKIIGLKEDLIACEDLKILRATVYTGTLLKFAGDKVKRGEVIAGAYYMAGERVVKCDLVAVISAECTYTYQYHSKFEVNDQTVSNAIATAKLMLGDYEVLSVGYQITQGRVITVTLKYEKILCGG